MNRINFKQSCFFKTVLALALSMALTACGGGQSSSDSTEVSDYTSTSEKSVEATVEVKKESSKTTPVQTTASQTDVTKTERAIVQPPASVDFAVWLAYWEQEDYQTEMAALGDKLKSIVHFAAYFDASSTLFVPQETTDSFQTLKTQRSDCTHYLSFVNDRLKRGGGSTLKDTALLEELFATDASMDKHAQEVVSLAQNGGYNGVEIDYENIKKNVSLWQKFTRFVEKLQPMTAKAGMKLRVVLEPAAPLSQLAFPEGPEYVMMCYNLFGSHSTPGPKADTAFIQELAQAMQALPGEKAFAFATGGFDWDSEGKVDQITELEARALEKKASIQIVRDSSSGAVHFNYTDEDGKSHEVWYADGETLQSWICTLQKTGNYPISLWRLSGNEPASLEKAAGDS